MDNTDNSKLLLSGKERKSHDSSDEAQHRCRPHCERQVPDDQECGVQADRSHHERNDHDIHREVVAVFNANTPEGGSIVRVLSNSGCNVTAILSVVTSRNINALVRLPFVTVKVADLNDEKSLARVVKGAHRAVFVTKYWEKFDTRLEESRAMAILSVCASQGVSHLVLSSFEDTRQLKNRGLKSQIDPDKNGAIHPKFVGMQDFKMMARSHRVQLTHMITSYLDQATSKKSLCLIVGESGKLIVQPNFIE